MAYELPTQSMQCGSSLQMKEEAGSLEADGEDVDLGPAEQANQRK